MPYFGAEPSSELANLDINGQKFILDADADTSITSDTDDQIDIEIAGADDFAFKANTFEVQTGSNIDMNGTELILDANGNTSITADTDDQIDFKIAGADDFRMTANTLSVLSGTTLNIDSGATIANSGTATGLGFVSGDVILADDGAVGAPGFAFADDTDTGWFRTGAGVMTSSNNNFATLQLSYGRAILNDTANGNQSYGMTLNQLTGDNEIFALKSSDIAHGYTGVAETDTYFWIEKSSATGGGAVISAANEATGQVNALAFNVYNDLYSNGQATDGNCGCTFFFFDNEDGDIDANGNLFGLSARRGGANELVFIVDEDGDIHADGSLAAYDEYDDAMLARTMQIELSGQAKDKKVYGKMIQTEFDNFVKYNKQTLIDAKLLGEPTEEGAKEGHRGLINTTGLQRLHNGAIVQQRAMFETMKSVVEEMLPGFADKLNERLEAQSLPALPA